MERNVNFGTKEAEIDGIYRYTDICYIFYIHNEKY